MDALAHDSDEGRGVAAISFGEALATCDPKISEWGNPDAQTASIFILDMKMRTC